MGPGTSLLTCSSSRVPQAPGSAMARARQEGSSPEPVEGLARDGPRPFPLGRLVPSAVSCGLCEPGLAAAPAAPALLPAAYLCAPTAPPAVTAALGGPRWPGGPRSRPRGPRPDGECPPRPRGDRSREERGPETRRNWRSGRGRGRGEVASPAGPLGGCGQCGLCVERSRKTEAGGGGGGQVGSPSWNLTAVPELQPTVSSGPGATAASELPSPSLGPLDPLEDSCCRECGPSCQLWALGRGRGAFAFICISLARVGPLRSPGGGRRGGGAIVLGKSPRGGGSLGERRVKGPLPDGLLTLWCPGSPIPASRHCSPGK